LFFVSEPLQISESAVQHAVDAAFAAVEGAADSAALKAVRIEHTGESSVLARLNATLRVVPADGKAALGKLVGQARAEVGRAIAARESRLVDAEEQAKLSAERVDGTAAASRWRPGARHPLALLQEEISDIFVAMCWEVAEGPELENEWFNFDSMNFDEDHPARAMQVLLFQTDPDQGGVHVLRRGPCGQVHVLREPGQRHAHQLTIPNCWLNRTSPSTMSRMSLRSLRNCRVRSMPIPKANPW
jgi:phenylalanyl-tRNA synthetase alpha chain